jgi:F0F1-type ATP synthase assembly protein I
MPEGQPDPGELGYYFTLAHVGLEMVVPMVVGILIDSYFRCSPWATVVGVVLGFTGGIVHLIVLASRHNTDRRSQPPGEGP